MVLPLHIPANWDASNTFCAGCRLGRQATTVGPAKIQLSKSRIGKESIVDATDGQDSYRAKEAFSRLDT